MMRIVADKIASASKNVLLGKELRVAPEVTAEEGYIVAGRLHGYKAVYNQLEDRQGRMVPLHDGDIVVGVLGHRNALHGYSGRVPSSVRVGDRLQVLNLGGVVGECTSNNPDVGKPFDFEVLGSVLVFPEFGNRTGVPAHVKMNAIEAPGALGTLPRVPVVFVAGTCMNSGKTFATCQLIRHFSVQGLRVGACKLTGVSLLRDVLNMQDYGAKLGVSFVDAGVVTTSADSAVTTARTLIGHLSTKPVDVIVAELGDGILGEYGVGAILADRGLMDRKAALVLCANDPVGAWGSVRLLTERYQMHIDVISGPTTDNLAGTQFIERSLGVTAINARISGPLLGQHILDQIAVPLAGVRQ